MNNETLGLHPRVWAEISRDKIARNLNRLVQAVAPAGVMAVLKADAYGLGVERIAQIVHEQGVNCFGVAEVGAAVSLKRFGLPVHVLGAVLDDEIDPALAYQIILPVTDIRSAEIISQRSQALGIPALVQFVVDTGMGRLGIRIEEIQEQSRHIMTLPGISLVGAYSHFPVAYTDREYSVGQVKKFLEWLSLFRAELNESQRAALEFIHMANSDGIQNIPEALRAPFNLVRTGINLYGMYDCAGERRVPLEEAVQLKSRLVAVRTLPAGASVGYGRTFVTGGPMRIGTISVGYADGMPIQASGLGSVLVRGLRCPILGRVSMDFTTISLEDVPGAQVGDEVICFGEEISINEYAELKHSLPYDILCSLGNRVERRIV